MEKKFDYSRDDFVTPVIVNYPENCTEEQKRYIDDYFKYKTEEMCSLYIMYEPECGCHHHLPVLFDRYPLCEKIRTECKECNDCFMYKLVEPLEFYIPLYENEVFTVEQLSKMHMRRNRQSDLIEELLRDLVFGNAPIKIFID